MKWSDYRAEVDALNAPDTLKARLAAMGAAEAAGSPTAAARTATAAAAPAKRAPLFSSSPAAKTPRRRAPLHFSRVKQLAALAACFALGAVACDAAGWRILPRMGSSMNSAAVTDSFYSAETAPQASDGRYDTGAASDSLLYGMTASGAVNDSSTAMAAEGGMSKGESEATPQSRAAAARKIIYTASLTLESKEFDAALEKLNTVLAEMGGYIESNRAENDTFSTRSSTLTVRVPADRYADFLSAAKAAGSMTELTENANDITLTYVDTTARIDSLTTQRDRLLALEQQAETLEDLLAVQDKLTDVQYELESWQCRLNAYDDAVDYCTVTLSIYEVKDYTPTETTFVQRLGNAFTNGFAAFGESLENLLVWLITALPWLGVIALAACGFVFWKKRHRT